MKRKYKIILATYALAAFLALGLYSFSANRMISAYQLHAGYSAARAFEETVLSVEKLRDCAKKSQYATDSAMHSRLCAQMYAEALSAESAMSTLPFSNYQLEQLAAFLNHAADYAALQHGQEKPDTEKLSELLKTADELDAKLRELQHKLNSGELLMDSVLETAANIGYAEGEKLSRGLFDYEQSLREQNPTNSESEMPIQGDLTQEEMKALAAEYAGVEANQLRHEYDYAGTAGRRCYSVNGTMICVSPSGVESLGQTRLVGEVTISKEQAEKAAQDYLKARGFEKLVLGESSQRGAVQLMKFVATENSVPWEDNYIKIAIAMDDASVYSFDRKNYSEEKCEVKWTVSSEEAVENLPDTLKLLQIQRVISSDSEGQPRAYYKLSCKNQAGERVEIYVDGSSGKQNQINVLKI